MLREEPARALLHGAKVEYRVEEHRRERIANRAIDAAIHSNPRVAAHLSAQEVMLAYDSIVQSYFSPAAITVDSRTAITRNTEE